MARSNNTAHEEKIAKLLMPTDSAREKLLTRRELGQSILNGFTTLIINEATLAQAERDFQKWDDFNKDLIERMFSTLEYKKNYASSGDLAIAVIRSSSNHLLEMSRALFDKFSAKIANLESLAERIELIEEDESISIETKNNPNTQHHTQLQSKKVFIVHGRDDEILAVVARFIRKCGLQEIILHEQSDAGRTIIEKIEQNSDIQFAIVLLTPDDLGGLASSGQSDIQQPRARQNVILELGYFIGRLGRHKVCALKKGDIELPSDFSGIVYTPYDGADEGWKLKLVREMKHAGLDFDLQQALI